MKRTKLEWFLYDLCLQTGFCLPKEKRQILLARDTWDAREFACEVLRLEGVTPEYEPKWVRGIAELFRKRFGKSTIQLDEFRN
jgi:hypothetical protein